MGAPAPGRITTSTPSTRRCQVPVALGCLLALVLCACDRRGWETDQESSSPRAPWGIVPSILPASPSPTSPAVPAPAPAGFERANVVGITATQRGHAIVLQAGERALPIFVGESEGLSIQLRLKGERFHRPLTHDLMDAVLEELGGTIESVRVERYEAEIFYSVVVLEHRAERREFDSRTSDAIALALGHDVPIFVRNSVLDSGSLELKDLVPSLQPDSAQPDSVQPHSAQPDSVQPHSAQPETEHLEFPLEPGTVAL
jgi:uncharacterized protein